MDNTQGSLLATRPKVRQSNIELLRILSMIMIVAHHISVHGGYKFTTAEITPDKLWLQFIRVGGKLAVDAFVLISGYFLINTDSIKISKTAKLWLQIFTYSVLCFGVFVALGWAPFGLKDLLKHILPVTFGEWWFASAYFMLYLLSPFLNKLLKALSQKQYIELLILLTICWSVIPTFLTKSWQSNNLLFFCFLYAIAGYLRLYNPLEKLSAAKCLWISAGMYFLIYLSAVAFDLLGLKMSVFGKHAVYFFAGDKLPILIASVFLFLGFSRLKIKPHKFINVIASASFGVYLIHENGYMRDFLWKKLFKVSTYQTGIKLIPYTIAVVAIVYVGCTLIELVRIYAVEKIYMKGINKMSIKLHEKVSRCIDSIL